MAEHLTRLELDEWLAGLDASGRAERHVAACPACGMLAERMRQARESSLREPRAKAVLARLEEKRARSAKPRWSWGVPLVAALAVGLALVVYVPRETDDGVRLKGSVALRLLSEQGAPVADARPGERVTLAVGTGPYRNVLVLAVDEAGTVERLWPQEGATGGMVEQGAEVKLSPPLEVTPGSVALHAFFSESPLEVEPARAVLAKHVAEARAKGQGPLDVETPGGIGKAQARTLLRVVP
ncbi:hypothetical protein [Corallococcus aberystwythensis]|uniref:DUF4384 domain-containing protein n=1 Tax=Corallococcus aberystwythensis TaxID=2316722 RepID=A0A3A8QSC0_9BACT|nr:hypothetical protein [Corallococcus aberystwythensis]RKH70731.1 hypothetical protein D7W81_08805 [Corallococcus aberystwythensis]